MYVCSTNPVFSNWTQNQQVPVASARDSDVPVNATNGYLELIAGNDDEYVGPSGTTDDAGYVPPDGGIIPPYIVPLPSPTHNDHIGQEPKTSGPKSPGSYSGYLAPLEYMYVEPSTMTGDDCEYVPPDNGVSLYTVQSPSPSNNGDVGQEPKKSAGPKSPGTDSGYLVPVEGDYEYVVPSTMPGDSTEYVASDDVGVLSCVVPIASHRPPSHSDVGQEPKTSDCRTADPKSPSTNSGYLIPLEGGDGDEH